MNTLKAGFSRVNVTPMMGIKLSGYFKTRYAESVLDDLEINALALACGDTKAVLMCIDHLGIRRMVLDGFRKIVSERTGIPFEGIYISATHTHTGPALSVKGDSENGSLELKYEKFLSDKFADAAQFALDDLKPAKMGYGVGMAPNIAFIRRYRMKDGSVRTNPGVDNPDIVAPIGEVDERVNVLR